MSRSLHRRIPLVVAVALAAGGATLALAPVPATADEDVPPEAPVLAIAVDVANDADGDGTFSDGEPVAGASSPVPFRVTVVNESTVAVTVTDVVDAMDLTTIDLLQEPYCPELAQQLAPGASISCTFTLDRYLRTYARPPRDQLVNVVEGTASHDGTTVTATDDSLVVNPNAGLVSVELALANDADGDGDFTTAEQAAAAGRDVPFRVTVSNASPGTATLSRLTATWDGQDEPRDLFPLCPALQGLTLRGTGDEHDDGGDDGHEDGHQDEARPSSVTCQLVLVGHSPGPGSTRTTTVSATLAKKHAPAVSATATATSMVSSAALVEPRRPAVTLAVRVGPVGGPFADHDVAPGLPVSVPATGAEVAYELEVANTGETTLTGIVIEDDALAAGTCPVPSLLRVGDAFRCQAGPEVVTVGQHVHDATVRALGHGQPVMDDDSAWYLGIAVEDPVGPEPVVDDPGDEDPVAEEPEPAGPDVEDPSAGTPDEDEVGVLPDVEERPGTAPSPAPVATTVPATAALPRTGADAARLVGAGASALLAGLLLLGAAHARESGSRRHPRRDLTDALHDPTTTT